MRTLQGMTQTTAEAQQELLAAVAAAARHLGLALAALGAASEQLDEHHGEQVEDRLFRPVQSAYGVARRAHDRFAERHGLPRRRPAAPPAALASAGPRMLIDQAAVDVGQADQALTTLQDSMLPVEVGDTELRGALADVRGAIGNFGADARAVVSRIGR